MPIKYTEVRSQATRSLEVEPAAAVRVESGSSFHRRQRVRSGLPY